MRNKSGLITNSPLEQLCKTDLQKVKAVDTRYASILETVEKGENDEFEFKCSWFSIRKTIKPYVFVYQDGSSDTILSRTKYEAIKKISHKRKEIISCYVETLPEVTRTLAIPREARNHA